MSQSYATVRRFPDAPPLSPDSPGRLSPAQLGLLPGALPGRGGPDVPRPFGEAGAASASHVVRGTLPASAAGPAVASLVNGLPFGGLGGPGAASAPDPAPPPPAAVPPGEVAPPPIVARSTVQMDVPGSEAGATPAPPPLVGAVAVAPPPVAPPPMVGGDIAPPPLVVGPPGAEPGVTPAMGVAAEPAAASPAEPPVDSPWLQVPVTPAIPAPTPPPATPSAPARPAPASKESSGPPWAILGVVAALLVVGGIVAIVMSMKSGRPDDSPLKMDVPSSSPRSHGPSGDTPEPDPEPTASAAPAPTPPPGPPRTLPGTPQPRPGPAPGPKPTAPTPTAAPKFDPSTI